MWGVKRIEALEKRATRNKFRVKTIRRFGNSIRRAVFDGRKNSKMCINNCLKQGDKNTFLIYIYRTMIS